MKDFGSIFDGAMPDDFHELFAARAQSFASRYPTVPPSDPPHSPRLLAAKWTRHDLYGEDMPSIAVEMLDEGYDTPSLRRLAGETNIHCSADAEVLVAKMFRELGVSYPISDSEAMVIVTRQIARQVIAGEFNAWDAARELRILWGRRPDPVDVAAVLDLYDDLDWRIILQHRLPAHTSELLDAFARLGALVEDEKPRIRLGLLEGQGWIAENFDEPLPEDIQEDLGGR